MCSTYFNLISSAFTWIIEHALLTPQQWDCGMFSDKSIFSLQSNSPDFPMESLSFTILSREHHCTTPFRWCRIARWEKGIILGSSTDLYVLMGTMAVQIYGNVILEQLGSLFRGVMGAVFVFMDNNSPHRANIVSECLQSEDVTRMD
ncbi:transposable element Tcb1 transposase [Trichonephila clavipes]|nr:transposable element Tcb1 transposase [Trichonephila clavipes]